MLLVAKINGIFHDKVLWIYIRVSSSYGRLKADFFETRCTMNEWMSVRVTYVMLSEWECCYWGSRLDDVPAVNRSKTFYTGYETPFTRATFTVHLQRKSLQYSTSLLLPCWIFSFISLISLLLQPGCPERIQIGISAVCSYSIWLIV